MKTVFAALALLSAGVVLPLFGQGDEEDNRKTLAGLHGIWVVVEDLNQQAQQDGLDENQIHTDVELKLRQAGITVLTKEEWSATHPAGLPYLYVNVQAFKQREGLYAFNVIVELDQSVRLVRNPSVRASVATWRATPVLGTTGERDLGSVRERVRDLTDQFINAYLAANPKR